MSAQLDLAHRPKPPPRDKMKPVTAAEVRAAMLRRYAQPEWALLFEVADATGFQHSRFADAIAMSLWPSRGLELHGFEIKVNRYDWRREKANPEKAETIAAYCDRWWVVDVPGVIDTSDEVPPAWGWLHFDGERFSEVRSASRTDAKAIDHRFLAALLRRADKTDAALLEAEVGRRTAAWESQFDERIKDAVARRVGQADQALKRIEAFEAASGINIGTPTPWGFGDVESAAEAGRAVKLVQNLGLVKEGYGSLARILDELRSAHDNVQAALLAAGYVPPKPPRRSRKAAR